LRSKLIEESTVLYHDEYEADDLVADRAKELREQGVNYLIISIDKDLKQICGYHFDYYPIYEKDAEGNKVFKKLKGLSFTSEYESWYMLAFQCLAGDSGDRVTGIPQIGAVKAKKILQGATTYRQMLYRVVAAYIRNAHKFSDGDWQSNLYMNYRLVYLGRS
jgi:5'-3' exonuclease